MKKTKLMLLPAILMMGLSACSKSTSGVVKIRVDYAFGGMMHETLTQFANNFNTQYAGRYEVEVNKIPGQYNDVLKKEKSDLQAGNDEWGDLVVCYPDHCVDYIELRKIVKLDQFMYSDDPELKISDQDWADYTDLVDSYTNIKYPATGTFAMPFAFSSECMFYNPVLLDLTVPGINNGEQITHEYINTLTWEELFGNFCPRILAYNEALPESDKFLDTSGTSGDYCVIGYDEDGNLFITMAEQYGFGYTSVNDNREASLDFNNENMRNLVLSLSEAQEAHYLKTMGSFNDKRMNTLFGAKKCLFSVGSTGGISYQQTAVGTAFEIECANIPQADPERSLREDADVGRTILQGGSFCILSHSSADNAERQKAAWLFYKYITNKSNQTVWAAQTGYAPFRNSVLGSEEWAEVTNAEGKTGIERLTAKNAEYMAGLEETLFQSAVFKGSSSARTYCDGLLASCLTKTPAQLAAAGTGGKTVLENLFDTAVNNIRNDM